MAQRKPLRPAKPVQKARTVERMPQRSEIVSGDESKGLKPIAASQKRNRTMQPATPRIRKPPKTDWQPGKPA